MAIYNRHFTLEEALAELPELRRSFARIHELLAYLENAQMQAERVDKLIRSNGHGSGHPDFGKEIGEVQSLVSEISSKGIEIKDLRRGLIDFPHWRNDEEVYLCWLYGEDTIFYWHAIDAGFAGRAPI